MTDDLSGGSTGASGVARRPVGQAESARANRAWWDGEADAYLEEHGAFLGDARFVWGPEGLSEADVHLLGEVAGRRVLEVGAGAAQCSRWLLAAGAEPVALDLSAAMLRRGRSAGVAAGLDVPVVQGDAAALPFADRSFDLACSAYGGVPFVDDSARVMSEVARVLRPGGRWVFSVTHPLRWCFPDDPGEGGLVARHSYFGDRVREISAAGLRLLDVVEPEWPADLDRTWGGWSPLRGRLVPGTAIFVCMRD